MQGLSLSVELTVISFAFALPFGALVAVMRTSTSKPLRAVGATVVESIRNVPLLAHLLFWYFAFPELLPESVRDNLYENNPEVICAVIALTLYSGVHMAEDIRSGIRAVPATQLEAARSLGLGRSAAVRLVLLPQALRHGLPSIVNQLVSTIKATSLGYIIGLSEVSFVASQINTLVFTQAVEVYLILALTCFTLCFGLSRLAFLL